MFFKEVEEIFYSCFNWSNLKFQVEQDMKKSINQSITQAVESYPTLSFKEWCLKWPGQVVLATGNIYWAAEVTEVRMQIDFEKIMNSIYSFYTQITHFRFYKILSLKNDS